LNQADQHITSQKEIASQIWDLLQQVNDPEVPVLSVIDLGIIRDVKVESRTSSDLDVEVVITPTYSGCPAMDVISMNIRMILLEHGFKSVRITNVLSPAWTTDWMTEAGKQKLKAFGIAPPNPTHSVCDLELFQQAEAVACPRCNSFNTKMISRFGSTPCKALYQCNDCLEPFDYFKCH
jgi:ring-1,2-phenylacetyl-CoA epoxidase subunit PaaD